MKNIVIISGSPKEESDSEKLANTFLEKLKQNNLTYNTQFIKLSQMNIIICAGCLSCKMTGICPQTDDMLEIKNSLKKTDFVIFCSPVHISHISSFFHIFLERSITDLHTFEYLNKPFLNIISTNGSGEEETDKYLTKIGLLFGMIKVGFTFTSKNDPFKEKRFQILVEKSKKILTDEIILKPTIKNKIYFKFMKMTVENNPEYFVYENKVWKEKGWIKAKTST